MFNVLSHSSTQRGVVEVQSRVGDLLDLEGCAGGVATALRQEGRSSSNIYSRSLAIK